MYSSYNPGGMFAIFKDLLFALYFDLTKLRVLQYPPPELVKVVVVKKLHNCHPEVCFFHIPFQDTLGYMI